MDKGAIVRALLDMGFGHFGQPGYGVTITGPDGDFKVGESEHLRFPACHLDPDNMHDKRGAVWVHPRGVLVSSGAHTYCRWLEELVPPNHRALNIGRSYPAWCDRSGDPAVSRLLDMLPTALGKMSG